MGMRTFLRRMPASYMTPANDANKKMGIEGAILQTSLELLQKKLTDLVVF